MFRKVSYMTAIAVIAGVVYFSDTIKGAIAPMLEKVGITL